MTTAETTPWLDRFGRALGELRVSVTDRCNFRCRYCMPKEYFGQGHEYVPRDQILSFEEITRVVRVLHEAGVRKVRITGGEPLLRHEVDQLISTLKSTADLEIAMTTNGLLLPKYAAGLRAAGLDRLTVSLDALDGASFLRITDSLHTPADVLRGISAAAGAGFKPIKINCVVQRGLNEHQIVPLVEHFRNTGHSLRFIEYMDIGQTNGWSFDDVVTASEILNKIETRYPLEPIARVNDSQTAQEYRLKDGSIIIGIVASVSQPFCRGCTRARLTSKGEFYTCLFGQNRLDVRELIRSGCSDAQLGLELSRVWSMRDDRYSETRTNEPGPVKTEVQPSLVSASRLHRSSPVMPQEMSYLGG
jgi:cyclic pyranopterin phosphate synthase